MRKLLLLGLLGFQVQVLAETNLTGVWQEELDGQLLANHYFSVHQSIRAETDPQLVVVDLNTFAYTAEFGTDLDLMRTTYIGNPAINSNLSALAAPTSATTSVTIERIDTASTPNVMFVSWTAMDNVTRTQSSGHKKLVKIF